MRTARVAGRVLVLMLALVSIGSPSHVTPAAETEQLQATNLYRQVYVPAERIDLWLRDGEKYIPVESRDFDAWIKASNQATKSQSSGANIDLAEYTAKLDDNGHIHGTARWTITLRGNKPVLLPLKNLPQHLTGARWQNSSQDAARIGAWSSANGEVERTALEVPSSGVLEFNWNAQSTSEADKILVPGHFPPSTSIRLSVELPDGIIPAMEGAVVLESSPLPSRDAASEKPRRRWLLAIPSSANANLQFSHTIGDKIAQETELSLSDDTTYELTQDGLAVQSLWRFEGRLHERRELSLSLSRGVQITTVSADGVELDWHIERASATSADRARITIPHSADRDVLELKIAAWFPLILDRNWKLPILRPDGVTWVRGTYQLTVAVPLELQNLNPIDCIQVSADHIGEVGTEAEFYGFTSYSSSAVPEVTIGRRQPDLSVRAGSSLVLSDPDVSGRLVAEFSVVRSSLHQLAGEIAPGWVVETVETVPADAMADWYIDRRGNRRQLQIQLTKSVSSNQKISVIVLGRLQRYSLATPIAADTLRVVNWSGARLTRHLLNFQMANPFSVELVGDLPFVDRQSLTDDDRNLLVEVSGNNRLVDLSAASGTAGLQLSFKQPTFNARIESVFAVLETDLRQTHQIFLEPEENSIDRVLIYATVPLGDGVKWIDKSSHSPIQAERLPASDPQMKNLPAEGELWLLRLPRSTSGPMQIVASSTSKSFKRGNLPLLSMPEAAQQLGRIVIQAHVNDSCFAEPSGLAAIPISSDASIDRGEAVPATRAAFRYGPIRCLTAVNAPKLQLTTNGRNETPSLLCRDADLESFYWPDGRATHYCRFKLENLGASEFIPPLLANVRLTGAIVNGQSVGLASPAATRSLPAIHLPPESRFVTVDIYFETSGQELSTGRLIVPPFNPDGSILSGDWKVWMPTEFHATGESDFAGSTFDWRGRWFGPLARSAAVPPFNPLRVGDWARAVNGLADWQAAVATNLAPLDSNSAPGVDSDGRQQMSLTAAVDQASALEPSPLISSSALGNIPAKLPGWHVYRDHFVANGAPSSIVIERRTTTTARSVTALLLAFFFGTWLCKRSLRAIVLLTATAAGLSLLLPNTFAPLATGAMWGLLLSCVAEWPRRLLTTNSQANRMHRRAVVAGSLALTLAITWLSTASANPGNAATNPPASQPHVERVLIPIDSNRKPSGTKYYVSEKFLRQLLPIAVSPDARDSKWLLRDASYNAEIILNRVKANTSPGTWSLTFDVETFSRDLTAVLPLVRDEATWQSTAMLDGVPTPLQWRDDGRCCGIQIDQPGRYALTINCIPKMATDGVRSKAVLTIPPSLSAVLQVRAPIQLSGLRINGGSANISGSEPLPRKALGATDHLQVEWQQQELKQESVQNPAITALSWLHIEASSIRLDTKYIIDSSSPSPQSLTISYDPRWTPLPASGLATETGEVDKLTGRRTLKVAVPAATSDRDEVTLHWQLTDPPSLGIFRVPTVEVASASAAQRWFAFSSDTAFECAISENSTSSATPKEFMTKWGAASESIGPQQVIDDSSPNRTWNISVRPRYVERIVQNDVHVAIGEHELRIAFQAAVTPGKPSDSKCKLIVPTNMVIDEVRLTEGDRQIPTRQVRAAENQLQIFFGHPIESDYRLSMMGRLPLSGFGPFAPPRVTFVGSDTSAQQLRLYRDDDVQVALQHFPAPDDSSTEPTDSPPAQWLVRPIGSYRLTDVAASEGPTFTISKSEPKLVGDTLVTLSRDSTSWFAAYHAQFIVQSGALDVLRLRAPSHWSEPFQIESNVPATVDATLRDETSRNLVVRFANTVAKGGKVAIKIRAALPLSVGAEVELPDISSETHIDGHRYAIVPVFLDSQPVAWADTGVRAAAVPPTLAPPSTDLSKQRQLEIISEPFRVAQQSKSVSQSAPRIRLADTFVSVGSRGAKLLVTRFVVASDGLSNCSLRLPPGQELRAVTLDGRPTLTAANDARHWRIALGPADLPQLLQIVSQNAAGDSTEPENDLRRPNLLSGEEPIPVDMSLWTVTLSGQPARSIAQVPAVTAADQAALRLDRLVSIAESTTSASSVSSDVDLANWFVQWSAMLIGVRERARNTVALTGAIQQVNRAPQDSISRSSERLEAWLKQASKPIGASVPTNSGAPLTTEQLSEWVAVDQPNSAYFVAEGGNDRVALPLESAVSHRATQAIGILFVAAFASATFWLARSPLALDFVCRWPHIVGLLIGIAWWAWLSPSWLGLVIMATSLWHSLRFDWPGRSVRAEASTVLRSTRTH